MNNVRNFAILLFALACQIRLLFGLPPVGVAAAGAVIGLASFAYKGYCKLNECCQPEWTRPGLKHLEHNLTQHLFGQHIAKYIIVRSIKSQVNNKSPSKPLVLSFHGPSGTGKNHVANIIADALYFKGTNSKFVKKIVATHEFPLRDQTDNYITKFKKIVFDVVSACEESLIIIDEVHNMPEGLLNYLSVYLDNHSTVDGVNFRKAIFILLSTVGEKQISEKTFDHWKSGLHREELTQFDMHNIIAGVSYNRDGGGFSKSVLIKHNLIDFFVPFLPLERIHVKQCITAKLLHKGRTIKEAEIDQMAGEILYIPENEKIFSGSGCRKIDRIIDLHV